MKRTILFLVVMIMASAMVFAGGSQETGSQESGSQDAASQEASSDTATGADSKSGGVLVFARSGDSVGLDPARETDGESFYGSTQIFDNLVEFVPGTTEIRPALAESWDIADDGLTFTFYLREGVTFHDGTPFNAEAVKFSFDRQRNEDHPYFDLGPWKYWGYMGMSDIVDDIVVEDEYTVRFDLKKVEAPFLANLAMDFAAIVSPTAVAELGEDFKNNPVGTGPFSFVEWVKDDRIVVERNEDYWRRPAYLDRLVLRVIPDGTARFLALQAGEVDVIDFPSPEDLEAMEADPNIELIQQPGLNVGYIAMNTDKEPFGNVLVRRASTTRLTSRTLSMRYLEAPASPPPTRSRRRCGVTTTTSSRTSSIRTARGNFSRRRDTPTVLRPTCGRCPSAGRTFPTDGPLRRSRRQILLRSASKRKSSALTGGRTSIEPTAVSTRWRSSAGPATTATRTTFCTCCSRVTPRRFPPVTSHSGGMTSLTL